MNITNKKGFTLVEGLVAMLLLMSVVMGIYGVLLSAYRSSQKTTLTAGTTDINITRIKKALEFAYMGNMEKAFQAVPCLGKTAAGEDLTAPPVLFRPNTSYSVSCLLPSECKSGSSFLYSITRPEQLNNPDNPGATTLAFPQFLSTGVVPAALDDQSAILNGPRPLSVEFIIDCKQD